MREKNIRISEILPQITLNNEPVSRKDLNSYKFRLVGIPPDKAIQQIQIDSEQYVEEIKKTIMRAYHLNPIFAVHLICYGKVLPDHMKLSELGIHPKKDIITVMAIQGGGGKREMKCLRCGTININEILVSFIAKDEIGQRYEDITTLPKFLYYLEHPADKRGKKIYQPIPSKIIKVKNYCCSNCYSNELVEIKRGDAGLRIPSRMYGI